MSSKGKKKEEKEGKHDKYVPGKLPDDLESQRTRMTVKTVAPVHTNTPDYHGLYRHLGVDNSFDFDKFQAEFQVNVRSMNDSEMVVDVIGIDPPIANALRRIIIAEVPTMAIETVYIQDNTSIMQDEVLAHRLGLLPLKVDPRLFDFHPKQGEHTETDTIVFKLQKECTRRKGSKDTDPDELKYENSRVMSGDLQWVPQGEQETRFADDPIRMVHDDIIICKLRPGQAIDLTCFCHKGIGKDHAKFSPVATATYRLRPEITIAEPFLNDDADKLVEKCPMKVFDIEDLGKGNRRARVANSDNCSMCRECIRDPAWEKKILLQRVKNHYIFSIESTGALKPHEIFEEAVKEFLAKIQTIRSHLSKAASSSSGLGDRMNVATD